MTSEETRDQMSADAGPVESPQRRTFLKGSLTAAAAVAGASGLAVAVESRGAEQADAPQARRPGGSFQLQFSTHKPPQLEDVQKAVAQILGHAGCATCGLLGVDLRLLAGDPIQVETNVPVIGSVLSR